ncbi:MAG TPA: cyclase family protein [Pirellulaceae bacterium]|nr:cyclase family protein [Pirellulaceae bacterium]
MYLLGTLRSYRSSRRIIMSHWKLAALLAICAGCTPQPQNVANKPAPSAMAPSAIAPSEPAGSKSETGNALKPLASGRFVDLSHPFDETTIYWPTEAGFVLERGNNGVTPKGYYYAANRFRAAEHGGTHIDAPVHFSEGGHTVDQIELSRLIGEAVVIDVSAKCEQDRDYLIGVADLRAWEEEHHRQLVDVIVLLRTGWAKRWPDRKSYLGTEARGPDAVAELHFPGLAPEAARWLVENRAPKAVGIDTASIDYGQSTHFQTHVTLCEHNVPGFENVANLDELPAEGVLVMALPMKIAGGSGGPLRIVACVAP